MEQQQGLELAGQQPSLYEHIHKALSQETKDGLEDQEMALLVGFRDAPDHKLPLGDVMALGGASHTRRISGLREKGWVISITDHQGHSPIYQLQRMATGEELRVIELARKEKAEGRSKRAQEDKLAAMKASGWKLVGRDGAPENGDLVAAFASFGYSIFTYKADFGFSAGTTQYLVLPKPVEG